MARSTFEYWLSMAKEGYAVEYVLSLNKSDPKVPDYLALFNQDQRVKVIQSEATNMVQASNAGASVTFGEILILMSDDMFPPWQWDVALSADFTEKSAIVLQVHDGIRNDIVTLPIMNRLAYMKLGYIYHPSYLSMFADNDLAETAKAHGMYRRSDVKFQHKHYTAGLSANDATYKHENSQVKYTHGQQLFERRKREGFPI